MGREWLTRGLLLRLGFVLTALGLCVHVYLEMKWQDPAVTLTLGQTTQSSKNWARQSRTKQDPAEPVENRSVKRRISYVRTLKKDSQAQKTKDVSSPLLQHRKVCFPLLLRFYLQVSDELSDLKSMQQKPSNKKHSLASLWVTGLKLCNPWTATKEEQTAESMHLQWTLWSQKRQFVIENFSSTKQFASFFPELTYKLNHTLPLRLQLQKCNKRPFKCLLEEAQLFIRANPLTIPEAWPLTLQGCVQELN